MAQLTIKGHATRGGEVIELLEMLGADRLGYKDTFIGFYYYIECDAIVSSDECPIDAIVFTLEEFEKKFHYKVGDKVIYEDKIREITKMVWEERTNTIAYKFDDKLYCNVIDDLQPYKEETMKEIKSIDLNKLEQQLDEALAKETPESLNKWLDEELEPEPKAPILSNRYDYAEGKCGYVIPDGYELDSIKQGFQTEIIIRPIKPQYPKDYEECCQHLGCDDKLNVGELIPFQQLVNARNAYWKIAGKGMGLDKPWKPDWDNLSTTHEFIKINKGCFTYSSRVLVFPTPEMRDAFLENFEDLIKECKELL